MIGQNAPIGGEQRFVAPIKDLHRRVGELERLGGSKITGWRALGTGTGSGASTTISVPVVCSMLRLTMTGLLTGSGAIGVRVNGDTTAGLHRWATRSVDGSGTQVYGSWNDGTFWRLADWTTAAGCSAVIEIHGADGSSAAAWHGGGVGIGSSSAAHRVSDGGGRLNGSAVITQLSIHTTPSASELDDVAWTLEGYIP